MSPVYKYFTLILHERHKEENPAAPDFLQMARIRAEKGDICVQNKQGGGYKTPPPVCVANCDQYALLSHSIPSICTVKYGADWNSDSWNAPS